MRKSCLLFSTVLILVSSLSQASQSIREEILSMLPQEISSLNNEISVSALKNKFKDKIKKESKNTLYLQYFSQKNDVTIGLKNGKFQYSFLKISPKIAASNKDLFEKVYNYLSQEKKKNIGQHGNTHESGRYIEVSLLEESMVLKFNNNESKSLHSVLFWSKGELRP